MDGRGADVGREGRPPDRAVQGHDRVGVLDEPVAAQAAPGARTRPASPGRRLRATKVTGVEVREESALPYDEVAGMTGPTDDALVLMERGAGVP